MFRPPPSPSPNAQQPNLTDQYFASGNGPGWTQGATLVDIISPNDLIPRPGKNFTILGVSVGGRLAVQQNGPTLYGKFGKIVIGMPMTPDSSSSPTGFGYLPYTTPALPLPSDLSLISTLWDPEVDSLPPSFANSSLDPTNLLPVYASIDLSIPLLVTTGISPVVGIWMLPSLLSSGGSQPSIQLSMYYATYSVVYDDLIP
jgi:hypothetical protein